MNKTYPSILDHYRSVIQDELRHDLLYCYDENYSPGQYEFSDKSLSNAIGSGFEWGNAKKRNFNKWHEIWIKAENNEIPCHPIQQVEKDIVQQVSENYQDLFNFFLNEHKLILLESEMDEIVHEVQKFLNK